MWLLYRLAVRSPYWLKWPSIKRNYLDLCKSVLTAEPSYFWGDHKAEFHCILHISYLLNFIHNLHTVFLCVRIWWWGPLKRTVVSLCPMSETVSQKTGILHPNNNKVIRSWIKLQKIYWISEYSDVPLEHTFTWYWITFFVVMINAIGVLLFKIITHFKSKLTKKQLILC